MRQYTGNKYNFLLYLFFLFSLSSINNLSLNKSHNFNLQITNISVTGLDVINNIKITNSINNLSSKNIFFIEKFLITQILDDNTLVHSYKITKIYPHTLIVDIKKTEFIGITIFNNNKFFIGSNKKLTHYYEIDKELPYVYGDIDVHNFIEFINLINKSELRLRDISKFYYYPSKRWDIKTKSGFLIKLSNSKLLDSLNLAYKVMNNKDLNTNKTIDLKTKKYLILSNEQKKI